MLFSLKSGHFAQPRQIDLPGWLLVAMPLAALVPKYFLITRTLGVSGSHIFEMGFGFGDYIRNLWADGAFRSCSTPPFASCGSDLCNYSTRMPGLPLLYVALAKVVGTQSVAVAFAKCTVSAILFAGFLFALARDTKVSILAVVLLFALYLGPQTLKHGASLEYEEGLLVDLGLCLAIAVTYLVRPTLVGPRTRQNSMAIAAILLATAMYFVKTTALITLVVVIALVLWSPQVRAITKGFALLCVAAPFALWIAHNAASSGAVHLSSSWNGENLYRGSSSEGLALYPQISLDRLFDSTQARLGDGTVVPLGNLEKGRCFADEWAWNTYYSRQARAWTEQHPAAALQFLAKKIWVTLFELRHTPYGTSATGEESEYAPAVRLAMLVWMGFARLVLLTLVILLIRELKLGDVRQSAWELALLAAGWVPFLLVFSYQRHIVPLLVMAGMVLVSLYLVEPRRTASELIRPSKLQMDGWRRRPPVSQVRW
jgi:hypothetical protein